MQSSYNIIISININKYIIFCAVEILDARWNIFSSFSYVSVLKHILIAIDVYVIFI